MATPSAETCGQVEKDVQSNQQLPGRSYPIMQSSLILETASKESSGKSCNCIKSPAHQTNQQQQERDQQQNRDHNNHHVCSKLQPQSQLKYSNKHSVIESMRDEVMRGFIRPPPNRIIICCDDCSPMCNCRHHFPHQSCSPRPSSREEEISTSVVISKQRGLHENTGHSNESSNRSEPELFSRSSSFSSTTHLIPESGLRKGCLGSRIKSSPKTDRGKNNNNNNNSPSSSPSNLIHSYFQSSNLIPTIFLSSLSKSSTRSSPQSHHSHERTPPRMVKGCQ